MTGTLVMQTVESTSLLISRINNQTVPFWPLENNDRILKSEKSFAYEMMFVYLDSLMCNDWMIDVGMLFEI